MFEANGCSVEGGVFIYFSGGHDRVADVWRSGSDSGESGQRSGEGPRKLMLVVEECVMRGDRTEKERAVCDPVLRVRVKGKSAGCNSVWCAAAGVWRKRTVGKQRELGFGVFVDAVVRGRGSRGRGAAEFSGVEQGGSSDRAEDQSGERMY
ncbi:uncharacterized protein MONOS_15722 [Monocercomonoides exilis]|uniref:uncharacterized protein n=1 Tax=Monocercomonoides exilis TaxID=2049356 RepID=UPI00355ABE01|nr:hypothetical protein MONOS_15722 [Monocercomonoides exilis]|eukprot:MONOS_15722.1-p1 / transcript=MONOS_15722.1 / gene=MONOS_15722 / organism=Monocercomonoides_exilis_PA203 / gene_product=unspecified product / transcript_product=unspecified product / location=Mono_scaffold01327:6147-7147(-) / protein_length=151 / sequence_SO=supercontig / SO=protein_coding / is_pseudo=false